MKDFRPALKAFLLADSAIATAVAARIYPTKIPQGVKATAIVYSRISSRPDHHMTGPSGLARPRYQIDAWAPTAEAAVALADLVKARLDGFTGVMGSGGAAVAVQGAFFADERDDYDEAAQLHRVSRDYFVNYDDA